MAPKTFCSLLILSLSIAGPAGAQGAFEVGARVGFSATEDEDFQQYEVYASHRLPWHWQLPWHWHLGTRLNASAGVLDSDEEAAFLGALGPSLVLSKAGNPLSLNAGVSAAFLGKEDLEEEDFGSHIQFISHVGVKLDFGWNLSAGYRFQHMSNAAISNQNPGLNMHLIELGYRF